MGSSAARAGKEGRHVQRLKRTTIKTKWVISRHRCAHSLIHTDASNSNAIREALASLREKFWAQATDAYRSTQRATSRAHTIFRARATGVNPASCGDAGAACAARWCGMRQVGQSSPPPMIASKSVVAAPKLAESTPCWRTSGAHVGPGRQCLADLGPKRANCDRSSQGGDRSCESSNKIGTAAIPAQTAPHRMCSPPNRRQNLASFGGGGRTRAGGGLCTWALAENIISQISCFAPLRRKEQPRPCLCV